MSTTSTPPTLRIRRSEDRGVEDFGWTDNWMTFSFANYHDPEWMRFGPLRVMVENHIQPHEGFSAHPHRDVEIVTYVSSGALTHEDNFGHKAEITTGGMQRISAGSRGMIHAEENHHDEVEHNYQMWLIPERTGTEFDFGQKTFSPDERRGEFRLYISPDGRDESLPINADAFIYAGLFATGDAVTHRLTSGRGAWIQVVNGELSLFSETLHTGDGIGVTNVDGPIDITFGAETEVLLFDVRMDAPLIWQ